MKGVILAAGVASRLRPLTDATPKCLLPLGGGTLLGRALDGLEASGISEVVIVTGYLEGLIRDYVRERHSGIRAQFVRNPIYASTNNIYSLWLAGPEIRGGGMLLLDSDILFDPRVLTLLQSSGPSAALAVRTGQDLGEEEIKVETGPGLRVRAIGKRIPAERAFGESIGIEIFPADAAGELFDALERKVVGEGAVDVFYEAAFQDWIDRGGTIRAVDVGDLSAIEIDTIEDLRRAERDFLPRLSPAR